MNLVYDFHCHSYTYMVKYTTTFLGEEGFVWNQSLTKSLRWSKIMKIVKLLCLMFAAAMTIAVRAEAELPVLYWMVNDPTVYDFGDTTGQKLGTVSSRPDGHSVDFARIRVDGAGGTLGYLGLLQLGSDSSYVSSPIDATTGLSTEDAAMYIDVENDPVHAGPGMSRVGSGYLTDEYLFTMELGFYDDASGDWLVMAISDSVTGSYLLEKFVSTDGLIVPGHLDWEPQAFNVPEPSSGLLVLLGGALMALRRKRRGACVA